MLRLRSLQTLLQNLWHKADGVKLLIGLFLYFMIDHVLPEQKDMLRDILEMVAYFFVLVGGGHKFIKSKYGQTIKTQIFS